MAKQRTLHVDNLTRQRALITQGRVADNFWTRLKGLTGVREFPVGDGLMIKPCNSIHTHFMAMPIDVLYVNAENQIVDMDLEMVAWRFGRPRKAAEYVLELPSGTSARIGCAVGDQLQITY